LSRRGSGRWRFPKPSATGTSVVRLGRSTNAGGKNCPRARAGPGRAGQPTPCRGQARACEPIGRLRRSSGVRSARTSGTSARRTASAGARPRRRDISSGTVFPWTIRTLATVPRSASETGSAPGVSAAQDSPVAHGRPTGKALGTTPRDRQHRNPTVAPRRAPACALRGLDPTGRRRAGSADGTPSLRGRRTAVGVRSGPISAA